MNGLKTFFFYMKYTMLSTFRLKTTLFWTLAFPLLLATFMYMAFGNLFEKDEMFKTINVAVVESENDDTLMSVLESLDVNHTDSVSKSDDKDDRTNSFSDLINMKIMDDSAAQKALNNQKVTGIIYTEDASLVVDENSYNATILESILTQYKQQKDVFTNIAKTNPAALETAIAGLSDTRSEYKEISLSSGNQDEYTNYFYAVFAMSCLIASFSSVTATNRLLANTRSLGRRKSLVPASKKHPYLFRVYITLNHPFCCRANCISLHDTTRCGLRKQISGNHPDTVFRLHDWTFNRSDNRCHSQAYRGQQNRYLCRNRHGAFRSCGFMRQRDKGYD